jgi:ribosomal protein S20
LNGVNRTLSDSEQKTADHIREFLKQAHAALDSGDVEGAQTLAAKAQVLLTELTK